VDNVLIAGIGKTGTTALYAAVKRGARAAGVDPACLFEPSSGIALGALLCHRPEQPVLTKIMVHRLSESGVDYDDFPHRLMLVRDPRDVIISRLLFRPLTRGAVAEVPPETLEQFVAALEAKERDPASWSVRALDELADELGIGAGNEAGLVRSLNLKRELIARHDFTVVRYEDLVDGELGHLEAQLGVPLGDTSEGTSGWLSHISRSKSYGAWRQWFLPDDVEHYDRLFADYLDAFSYPRGAVLPDEVHIEPATASEYVRSRAETRRREVALRHDADRRGDAEVTDEELAALEDMADDGDAVAARRAARSHVARGDSSRAVHLAREAAVRGDLGAMRLLCGLLRAEGDSGSLEEAEAWEQDLRRVAPLYRQIRVLRSQVRRLEASRASEKSDPPTTASGAGTAPDGARRRRGLAGYLRGRRPATRRDGR
jgi:hypothetical protein